MSDGSPSAAVLMLTLSAPASITPGRVVHVTGCRRRRASGMKTRAATSATVSREGEAVFDRRRDVEHDEFVDAFVVVAGGQRRRVAGVAEPLEVDALHDAAVANVEAGDEAPGQQCHGAVAPSRRRARRSSRASVRPVAPDFSGWNCTPKTWPRAHGRREPDAVRRAWRRTRRDRRRVGVREVERTRPSGRPAGAAPAAARPWTERFQPTCGTFRRAPSGSRSGSRVIRPGSTPRPGSAGRFVAALEQPLHAEADAEDGTPSANAPSDDASRQPARRATRWRRSGRRRARRSPAAPARSSGARGCDAPPAPMARSALRTDVRLPGAVVDERDHSSSFVLGSMRASRRSRAQATRSARANALNDGLDLVVARPAVEHLHVHVGAGAERETLEEVRRPAPTCRSPTSRGADAGRTTACGRPPRSTAATASVSSIGITK